tara:strand:- start:236 stop:1327 length:1092 start_codon:yes stop_codon:yes gene_type:complete
MQLQAESLKRIVSAILEKGGSCNNESQVVANHLVRANLLGHDSHGVGMLPFYVKMLNSKLLFPNQEPAMVKNNGSIMMFDGKRGYGQAVGKIAMEQAIEKCRETGLVLMTIRNSHHLGRIGTYGEQSIEAGMVSIHFVNVTDHFPLVAPFRGSDARFSTNPICLAMPGTKKQSPVLLDMATSGIALGKARVAINKNETLEDGLVVDHKGQPSNNPGVMSGYLFPEKEDNPPLGALTPLGNYKGYGLALFCELFGGILSGGGTIQPGNKRHDSIINNMFTLLINPEKLVDIPWMKHEIEQFTSFCKKSPPANPEKPVLVAGDPERFHEKKRKEGGIPVDKTTWEQILKRSETLGLSRIEIEKMI